MQKKIGFSLVLLMAFALWGPRETLANTGYEQTIIMWQEVEAQVGPYQLVLQNLFAEVESQVGPEKSKLYSTFAKRLNQGYPGSMFVGGVSGNIAINNYTKAGFDSQWDITSLVQEFNGLVKTYNFRQNTLLIVNGPNRIQLRLDLQHPERSRFTDATIPALAVTAKNIWSQKGSRETPAWPLRDILNDVYANRLATQSQPRMDELAEAMMNNQQTRSQVLGTAEELYRDGIAKGTSKKISPFVVTPSSSGLQASLPSNIFTLLPWYFWPGVICASVLSVFSSTKRRRRKSKSRTRAKTASGRPGTDSVDSEPFFESRQTLNTHAEQAFLLALQQSIDGDRYLINGKTRLADLIKVESQQWGSQWQTQFNRISRKHVDFVILERSSSRIIGVIELDDSSHQRSDRRERDRFVDQALERAGIPILHYPCLRKYPLDELGNHLQEKFGITARPIDGGCEWKLK